MIADNYGADITSFHGLKFYGVGKYVLFIFGYSQNILYMKLANSAQFKFCMLSVLMFIVDVIMQTIIVVIILGIKL